MPEDRISLNYDFRGKVNTIHFKIYDTWASLPYDAETKEFDESNPITKALREWEKVKGDTLDLSDRTPEETRDLASQQPAIEKLNNQGSRSAVILHSKPQERQLIEENISPLIVDGLRSGSYSNFGYPIWVDSRIHPQKIRQNYNLRVRFLMDSASPGNVLFISLTIPETGQVLYRKPWAAMQLIREVITEEFIFFSAENFVTYGAMIGLSATGSCEIYEPSLYLKEDA